MSDVIRIWEKIIDVQMHFNDLELRIRNYAVTVLVAILGAAALTLKEHLEIVIRGKTITLAVPVLFAGAVGWCAFYFMDRFWYHRLLYGAISHGKSIEDSHKTRLPELRLTDALERRAQLYLRRRVISESGAFTAQEKSTFFIWPYWRS